MQAAPSLWGKEGQNRVEQRPKAEDGAQGSQGASQGCPPSMVVWSSQRGRPAGCTQTQLSRGGRPLESPQDTITPWQPPALLGSLTFQQV